MELKGKFLEARGEMSHQQIRAKVYFTNKREIMRWTNTAFRARVINYINIKALCVATQTYSESNISFIKPPLKLEHG